MQVAWTDSHDRAGLRDYVQFNKYTHRVCLLCRVRSKIFVISIIDWEDQCEWHRMARITGQDCAGTCNLINTHIPTHTSGTECLG